MRTIPHPLLNPAAEPPVLTSDLNGVNVQLFSPFLELKLCNSIKVLPYLKVMVQKIKHYFADYFGGLVQLMLRG